MLGIIRHDGANLSLRQICLRYDAIAYHDNLMAATIVAGLYNANGGVKTDGVERAALPTDFHPEHAQDENVNADDRSQGELAASIISSAASSLNLVDT